MTMMRFAICLDECYTSLSSTGLPSLHEGIRYYPGENTVSIFSRFAFGKRSETWYPFTSVCVEILSTLAVIM